VAIGLENDGKFILNFVQNVERESHQILQIKRKHMKELV
jgi:hypothetical protein